MIEDAAWCCSWFHLPYGMLLFCISLGSSLKTKEEDNTFKVYKIVIRSCIVLDYSNKVYNWGREGTENWSLNACCTILQLLNREYIIIRNRKKLPIIICKSPRDSRKETKTRKCCVYCHTQWHTLFTSNFQWSSAKNDKLIILEDKTSYTFIARTKSSKDWSEQYGEIIPLKRLKGF